MVTPPPPPPPSAGPRGRKAPLTLFGLSFAAIVAAFFFFVMSEKSPQFVVPGGAAILYALAALGVGGLGLLGGLISMIWIARLNGRSHE